MTPTPYHSKSDRDWILMLNLLADAGPMGAADLAPACECPVATVRDRLEICEAHGVVKVDRTGKRNRYAVGKAWEVKLNAYFADRYASMRKGPKRAPLAEPKPSISRLLAAACAVRPDVHTTWRMPEAERAAA